MGKVTQVALDLESSEGLWGFRNNMKSLPSCGWEDWIRPPSHWSAPHVVGLAGSPHGHDGKNSPLIANYLSLGHCRLHTLWTAMRCSAKAWKDVLLCFCWNSTWGGLWVANRKFIYGRMGRWQDHSFVWVVTFKWLLLIILEDFNNVDLFLHNVCGTSSSVAMNKASFNMKMKAYPRDYLICKLDHVTPLLKSLQWLSFAFRIKSKVYHSRKEKIWLPLFLLTLAL